MILFRAEAILASSTSKFGIEIPRVDDEDLKSSTESTNSTSLIRCIAAVGNCEQVHTSVLNLIFQQAKVAGVRNLSKMKIRNLQSLLVCPIILWRVSSTEDDWIFGLTVRTGISDLGLVLVFSLFSAVDMWIGSSIVFLHVGFNSWGYGADEEVCGCAKTFPDIPDCIPDIWRPPQFCRCDMKAGFNSPSNGGCLGNNPGGLLTCGYPLQIDSASIKSLESFMKFTSFCSSWSLPDNSIIIFWSSMNFCWANSSKVEFWNYCNSFCFIRSCWWTSRKSCCCRNNSSL